jgi:glycosyltransferase involved in cell wall biosynthesis
MKDSLVRPHLSVVMPAFQEEGSLEGTLDHTFVVLERLGRSFEVLVCDDGSRDGTPHVLGGLQKRHPRLRILRHRTNQGVGQALKTLYRHALGDWVLFLPADGQVAADQIPRLLRRQDAAVVLGWRHPRRDPLPRLLASWGYNLLVRLLWGLKVRDVDSVVMYRRDVLDIDFCSRDLCLPVEILLKAVRRGLPYAEVPIEHHPRRAGRAWGANPRVVLRTLSDLLAAWWHPARWA